MAQTIVKTIKTEKEPKPSKVGLEQLPEVKPTERPPKISKASEKEKRRARAGFLPGGINLKGRPKLIEDGKKIK